MSRPLSRRRFVQHGLTLGAAGAGLASLPARAAGRAPSDKITIGCIGMGGRGTGNMKIFLGLPECRVVAVCDTYEDRRQKAKHSVEEQYDAKGCDMYADYRELLARKDIDAVMIAAQDHWHALMATAAAKAGKDMYCEKPLGVSVAESRLIRDTIRSTKRVFQTGTWQRAQGNFQKAVNLVRNGYVGKIHTLEVAAPGPKYRPKYTGPQDEQPVPEGFDWKMWRGPAPAQPYNEGRVSWPDWYLIWDYCAGFICNWGVHHLDIANWGCPEVGNEPFEVTCQATYRHEGFTDNVDTWHAEFTYAGGLKMIFTDNPQQPSGTKFIGDEGWVYIDRSGIAASPESLLKLVLKPTDLKVTEATHHGDDFLTCIRTRKDPVSDVDASHKATTLGLVADIAGRLKQTLKWDPRQQRFVDNEAANAMLVRPMHNGWSL